MEKLGYIVSKRNIKNVPDYIGVVDSVDAIDNPNMPIMYVGVTNAKKSIDGFSAIVKSYDNEVFWTFGKTESRIAYEEDLEKFYKYCANRFIHSVRYYYFNIFTVRYNRLKKLVQILKSDEKKYIYICKGMIYIFYNNYVLGLSLTMLEYCGIKEKKVIGKLYQNKANIISYDDTFLDSKLKSFVNNKRYVIPYLMSMK